MVLHRHVVETNTKILKIIGNTTRRLIFFWGTGFFWVAGARGLGRFDVDYLKCC